MSPAELRAVAAQVAGEAAELVRRVRPEAIRTVGTKSSDTDVVTAADTASERLLRARLAELRPGEPVLGEETGLVGSVPAGTPCWVVDPLDGTVNYLYGLPWYAVSVAAMLDGMACAGAIVEPATGRVWTAATGLGASCDGSPLRVSATDRVDLAMLATGFSYRPERRARQARMVAGILPEVRDLRRAGSAALDLCAVAAGWVDGFVEHGLGIWDWAAGALIAEEAGAVVRRPPGGRPGEPAGLGAEGGVDGLDELGADAVFAAAPGVAGALAALGIRHGAGEV
jgi:myo-inositol-1(or 4)-monophosphatase